MSGQSRWWDPVLVHAAEPLCHSHDGSILRLQFLEMALGALNDEDRLREVRGVDDGELSAGGRGHKDENEVRFSLNLLGIGAPLTSSFGFAPAGGASNPSAISTVSR